MWLAGHVIVVVEGPSAAGKTTWCRQHVDRFVPEYVPTGDEPDGNDPDAQAGYWTSVNVDRWSAALRLETAIETAVCDGDPLKLHYSWSLARIGAAPPERFQQELAVVRRAFGRGALGLPDLALVTIPDPVDLQHRKDHDPNRRRRHFDLHLRLAEPLREWYSAMVPLDPDRVLWDLPADGIGGLPSLGARRSRSDVKSLDLLVAALPDIGLAR